MIIENQNKSTISTCFHCGVKTRNAIIQDGHQFCCNGCKNVYQLLNKNNLCKYYDLNNQPGNSVQGNTENYAKFNFLEDEQLLQPLLSFDGPELRKLAFYLPQIHCSSCLYLLENLHKINPNISVAQLNFTKKELSVSYLKSTISAKEIAVLLSTLGYEPYFSLSDVSNSETKQTIIGNKRLYRLGVAGFAFSNIMLMSFPEYFDWGKDVDGLGIYFQWFSFILSIPVFFYSAQEFYSIAWGGIKKKYLTIDLPIVLALIITFSRSIYEIITQSGPGYFDSLSGIVFFMLLGRYLQDKTYENLSFSRDYSSYFPLSAHVWNLGKEQEVAINEIKINDEIIIHNQEIIVCDGILASGLAVIDYSFVTGESAPVTIREGEWLYAGGRQLGSSIRLIAQKTVAQGYLVSLWNQSAKENEASKIEIPIQTDENNYIHVASQWFTIGLFLIAIVAAIYWFYYDPSQILHVVTSILIVACPCALLLSVTFTNGHVLSALARHGLYVRNATSLERWRNADVVIFDKTGTLTDTTHPDIHYSGKELSDDQLDVIAAVTRESIHPVARAISKYLDRAQVPLESVENVNGQGVCATSGKDTIRIGNRSFVGLSETYSVGESGLRDSSNSAVGSEIWIRINHEILGFFTIKSRYRQNLELMMKTVGKRANVSVLSGDNSSEESQLLQLIPYKTPVKFEVKPHEKKDYIAQLQLIGKKVMMVGDGLNDVAAMQQANFSIAVTENVGFFTPGSDAIILGSSLSKLHRLWALVVRAKRIIWWSFAISLMYNVVGLSFAVSGSLNPLIAAILMPVSSISIVIFTYVTSNWGYWLKR